MSLEGQARVDAKLKEFRQDRKRRILERSRETATITVEERDLRKSELGCIMRVEWRGQRCIAPRVTHLGRN